MVVTIDLVSPPTPPDGSTVNVSTVEFTYTCTDTELGIANLEYSFDGTNFTSVRELEDNEDICSSDFFPDSGTFEIEFAHGAYVIYFRAVDYLNNIGPELVWHLNVDITTSVAFDPVPPSITNNPGLLVSGTREAGATVTVKIGTTSFAVSYPSATTWESTVVLLEGTNIIVATATDAESNQASAMATVVLDTVIPGAPVVTSIDPAEPNYGDLGNPAVATNEPNQTLNGEKEANTSIWLNGVEVVVLNMDTTFSIPVVLVEGDNELMLQAKDGADNESEEATVEIFLDTAPPTSPSIVINDGVEFTLTRDVTLTLSADNAIEVKVSENPGFPNAEWLPFEESPNLMPFELSRRGGQKIVYAVFRDEVGNETTPVFDDIILPSTISEEVSSAETMTIQELDADPEDEYLIRLQDNRDGTYSVQLYLDLTDALNGTSSGRVASASSSTDGEQTLVLVPDAGGPTGTITLTFVDGGEMLIYRFRTDAYEADEGEIGTPLVYSITETEDAFEAQTLVPLYRASVLGRVLEAPVDGDLRKLRISKAFGLHDEDTAVLGQGEVLPLTDQDGPLYPMSGARFDYPLLTVPAEVVDLVEEEDAYLITIDRDLERFDPTFGYEMLFSKKRGLVTDYKISKEGRVEFLNESMLASGNADISYTTPQIISSVPSSEFKAIVAAPGSTVEMIVRPTNNQILLSDLDRVAVRFFHSLGDTALQGPLSIEVTINDTYSASTAEFTVASSNTRAEIREFSVNSLDLFPGGLTDTYGPDNPVLEKVVITFVSMANLTYSDELQVIAESSVVSSNCRVVVNGEEVHKSTDRVTNKFDLYELRVQNGLVDVLCNDQLIHTETLDLDGATASFGAGARVSGDVLDVAFNRFDTIQYIDQTPTALSLPGRYTQIEGTLRENSEPLLEEYELDFESAVSEYPERIYAPDILSGDFLDVSTVAIVGTGHREEVLVAQGAGEEDEGEPVDFDPNNEPDGRHFELTSFPVVIGSLEVTLVHNSVTRQLEEDVDYLVNLATGHLVLHHPIALGDRLSVKYVSEADVNVPELFLDIDDLIAKFGTPSLENTLSLGAQIAFENGAKRVLAVQALDPTVDPGWTDAYEALRKEEAYFVVPLPPNNYALVASLGVSHVEEQSNVRQRHERVLILGESAGVTGDDLSAFRGTFRAVFVQPGTIRRVVAGETLQLEGMFLAAAYAGRASALSSPALPMTAKTLTGFDLTGSRLTNIELEQKIKDRITYIRRLASGGQIHRSITTSDSKLAVEQEPSIIRIRDFLAINLRHLLETRYVGQPIVEDTPGAIAQTTEAFLNSQQDSNIVTVYRNVRAHVDSVEPRQINVAFDVQPAFPLNDIMITVRVVTRL